ncbi:putative branched-chain amino acid carrier protein SSP1343 [Rodentibacter pneumotropicus]|uniref:Branched-chain amino acid transport system carrier protein n=1 Tax=Rodentibacter pneumotropicus TaxID=758 RepID=A0A3S4TTA2_9PAST|nr:putative branched-chain amino acid carrier protein SSP1343 [Rodentibacter pneumotropicus]
MLYSPPIIYRETIIMIKKAGLTGLLLFGMFFGAGNLIFPPSLGALSGEQFWEAILGFVLSGVGIAVLALIIGMLNPKGYVDEISQKISPWFATLYLVILYLSIGPFSQFHVPLRLPMKWAFPLCYPKE